MTIVQLLFSLAIGSAVLSASAQNPDRKRINHWYFGFGAGLDFSSGSPVADTTGAYNYGYGSAVMSDVDGNPLFYTDGRQVWNAQHDSMPNGDINGYMYFGQCVQAPIAVPKPGSEHIYYIFTSDGFSSTPTNGLQYHVVDMSLNSGLGAVVEKNVQLYATPAEQMCVTRHENTCDYWLLGHDRNSADYLAWQISPEGIDSVPIVSTAGPDYSEIYQVPGNANWTGGIWMKSSPQGDKLVSAVHWRITNSGHDDEYWLSRFDADQGIVSGTFLVPIDTLLSGFAFSANGNVFYAGYGLDLMKLDQFNLADFDSAAVMSSRVNVWTSTTTDLASDLELGPDGKLYGCTRWGYVLDKDSMAVIHYPDVLGPGCQVQLWGIGLEGRYAGLQILDYVSSFSSPVAPDHDCSTTVEEMVTAPSLSCWSGSDGVVVNGIGLEVNELLQFRVVNMVGQVLASGPLPRSRPCILSLPALPSGHYFLQLHGPTGLSHLLHFLHL